MLEQMAPMLKMEIAVKPTGETKKIRDWSAKKYDVTTTGAMGTTTIVIWATRDLKLDMSAYKDMMSHLEALNPGAADLAKELAKIEGVEVLKDMTTSTMGVNIGSREELVSVEDKPAPAGHYELPAGYKQTEFNPFAKPQQGQEKE